jgi:hypothetical protein
MTTQRVVHARRLDHFAALNEDDEADRIYWCDDPDFEEVISNLHLVSGGRVGDLLRVSWDDGSELNLIKQEADKLVVSLRWLGRYFYLSDPEQEPGHKILVELDGFVPSLIDANLLLKKDFVMATIEFLFGKRHDLTVRMVSAVAD